MTPHGAGTRRELRRCFVSVNLIQVGASSLCGLWCCNTDLVGGTQLEHELLVTCLLQLCKCVALYVCVCVCVYVERALESDA